MVKKCVFFLILEDILNIPYSTINLPVETKYPNTAMTIETKQKKKFKKGNRKVKKLHFEMVTFFSTFRRYLKYTISINISHSQLSIYQSCNQIPNTAIATWITKKRKKIVTKKATEK